MLDVWFMNITEWLMNTSLSKLSLDSWHVRHVTSYWDVWTEQSHCQLWAAAVTVLLRWVSAAEEDCGSDSFSCGSCAVCPSVWEALTCLKKWTDNVSLRLRQGLMLGVSSSFWQSIRATSVVPNLCGVLGILFLLPLTEKHDFIMWH